MSFEASRWRAGKCRRSPPLKESDAMLNVMPKVAGMSGMQNAKRCKKCIWWQKSPNPTSIRIFIEKKNRPKSDIQKTPTHRFFPRNKVGLNQPCGEGRKSEYYFPAHATQPFQSPRAAQTILNFVTSWVVQWKTASNPAKSLLFKHLSSNSLTVPNMILQSC